LDPAFAGAYAHLAQAYSLAVENNWTMAREQTIEQALAAANKGVELNDELPYAHWSLGRIYTRPYIADFDRAKAAFEKAIALNPNYADSYAFLGLVVIYMGKADEAMGVVDKAMHINPHYPFWYLFARGMAQLFLNRYDDAIRSFKMALERNPNVPWLHAGLIAAYGHRGERDEADWIISELDSLGQPATIHKIMERIALRDSAYRKFFENGLRKAGVRE